VRATVLALACCALPACTPSSSVELAATGATGTGSALAATALPGATAGPTPRPATCPAALPAAELTLSIEGTTLYVDRAAVLDLGGAFDPAVLARALDARLEAPHVAALRAPPGTPLALVRTLLGAIAGPGRVQTVVADVPPCPVVVALAVVATAPLTDVRTLADLTAECLRPGPCVLEVAPVTAAAR
jgi:hypothetical protein